MYQRILCKLIAPCIFAAPLCADSPAENLLRKPDDWFRAIEGRQALESILSWQTEHGDWPKNMDTTSQKFSGGDKKPTGTFDNGATSGELRVLARAYRATGDARYKQAFLRGFDHVLKAQYPNGGWPQFYPLSTRYHRHITFNDGTMIRLMEFLRDATVDEDYSLLDEERRKLAERAVEHGVDCIVKCQIVVDGVPTVWCAQHDAQTLLPVQARNYELPSLSGAESAGILIFLMSLDKPAPRVIRAVKAGAAWFDLAKIEGYRYRKSRTEKALTKDPKASPLWARFYEIKSSRPIFSDRDGVLKYDIEEIGSERRGGYTWYGNWGDRVAKTYAEWPHRNTDLEEYTPSKRATSNLGNSPKTDRSWRTWTSADGKYTVEAKFIEFEDGKVHLEKLDGSLIEVKPGALSRKDIEYYRAELKRRKCP